jgi:nucleoid-associated protein YgaU
MGHCLRGKMSDAGIIPAPAVAATDMPTPAPEAVALAPAQPIAPAPAAPPAETPAPAESAIAANFGLLRAEPDGSVVIAGSGTPGSEVEVFSDGASIGRTSVESSGDWVLVPEAPLPPGGTELTLGEVGEEGQSSQSFVVVIDEAREAEPLVVASTPGQASEILQGIERPAAGSTTEVAAAEPPTGPAAAAAAAPPAVNPPISAEALSAPGEPAQSPAAVEVNPAPAPASGSSGAAGIAAAPEQQVGTQAVPPATIAVEPEQAAAAAPASSENTAPLSAPNVAAAPAGQTPAAPQGTSAAAPAPSQQAALDNTPARAEPATVATPAGSTPPPSIDAIEVEGGRAFFAGAGPEGGTVRLYVDDQFIADAEVADGRWLVESGNVLTKPNQRIRVDLINPADASVSARAEVDFVLELPTSEAPTAVAQAPVTTPAAPTTTEPPGQEAATTAPQQLAAAGARPSDISVANAPASQPSAADPAPVRTSKQPGQIEATAPASAAASGASTASATPSAAPSVPAPEAPAPASAPAAQGEVPTMVAVQVGDAEDQRFASGKAIIRRGDNLWTIARRVYGAGIKYTTIYQANNSQIRDPNRIYPGQVFDLPDGER